MVGDVNIDLNPDNNSFYDHTTKSYMDVLDNFAFVNTITSPTRYGNFKNSIIDHIAVNRFKRGIKTCTVDYLLADHQPCIISIEISSQFANKSKHTIFTKTDYKALRNKVEEHDWSRIIDPCSVQLSMENFLSTFEALIKSSSTEVKAKVHKVNFKQPWMTRDLLTLTEKRRQLHVQSKKEPLI